jgi:hypothetical protein
MAILKKSFIKNSLHLLCYGNATNEMTKRPVPKERKNSNCKKSEKIEPNRFPTVTEADVRERTRKTICEIAIYDNPVDQVANKIESDTSALFCTHLTPYTRTTSNKNDLTDVVQTIDVVDQGRREAVRIRPSQPTQHTNEIGPKATSPILEPILYIHENDETSSSSSTSNLSSYSAKSDTKNQFSIKQMSRTPLKNFEFDFQSPPCVKNRQNINITIKSMKPTSSTSRIKPLEFKPILEEDSYDDSESPTSLSLSSASSSRSTSSSANKGLTTKRCLSSASSSSTKKSVHFADSIGLDLESILHVRQCNDNDNYFFEYYDSFDKDLDVLVDDKPQHVFKEAKESNAYARFPKQQRKTIFNVHITSKNNVDLNNHATSKQLKTEHSKKDLIVKQIKSANLTINTRINPSGKLESEV